MTPCATCGHPLRWMPDARGWACDRCRHFYATLPAPAAGRSRAWIFLAITVVLTTGAVAIAVLATRSDAQLARDDTPPPKQPVRVFAKPGDEYLAKYEEVTDRICACSTMECATQANLELGRWVMSWAADDTSRVDFDAETTAKKKVIEQRNTGCLVKLAKAPAAHPAAPPAADPGQLAPAPADMPAECAALRDVIATALTCKGSDPRMHAGYITVWSQMLASWSAVSDASGRKAYLDSCPQVVDGIRSTIAFLCNR